MLIKKNILLKFLECNLSGLVEVFILWEHLQICLFVPTWMKSSSDSSNFRKETQFLDQILWVQCVDPHDFFGYVQISWRVVFSSVFDHDRLLKLGEGNSWNWERDYHQYVFQTVTKALQEHLFFLFFYFSVPTQCSYEERNKWAQWICFSHGWGGMKSTSEPPDSEDCNNKQRQNQELPFCIRNILTLPLWQSPQRHLKANIPGWYLQG